MSSNNSTIITLDILSLQLGFRYTNLILCFFFLIAGCTGNILNIIVFIKVGNYKHNACSFYMFVRCFIDFKILFIGLITRILTSGFQLDFTLTNRIWCKLRIGILDIDGICIYTLICLQSIDVFLCSSSSANLRNKSNVKIARYLSIGIICFWSIHELPFFLLQDLVIVGGTPMCIMTNTIFAQYRSYFVALCINVCIPIIIVSIFGFLTVQNMKQTGVKRALSDITKQTINMALFQIIAVLLFNGPYAAWQIYSISTSAIIKDAYRQVQEQLISSFFIVYAYGLYASSFYCYCLSKRFRNEIFLCLSRPEHFRRKNEVYPMATL